MLIICYYIQVSTIEMSFMIYAGTGHNYVELMRLCGAKDNITTVFTTRQALSPTRERETEEE